MQISVDISMYPFKDDYIPAISAFIAQLNEHQQVEVKTNSMTTQLFGDYDEVMALLQATMRHSMETFGKLVFVAKFIPGNTRQISGYE